MALNDQSFDALDDALEEMEEEESGGGEESYDGGEGGTGGGSSGPGAVENAQNAYNNIKNLENAGKNAGGEAVSKAAEGAAKAGGEAAAKAGEDALKNIAAEGLSAPAEASGITSALANAGKTLKSAGDTAKNAGETAANAGKTLGSAKDAAFGGSGADKGNAAADMANNAAATANSAAATAKSASETGANAVKTAGSITRAVGEIGTTTATTTALTTAATTAATAAGTAAAAGGTAAAGSGLIAFFATPPGWITLAVIAAILLVIIIIVVVVVVIIVIVILVRSSAGNVPVSLPTDFYGIRIYYKNDKQASKNQENNYNQLALEFLKSVEAMEEVASLNITFPEEIFSDLTEYKQTLAESNKNLLNNMAIETAVAVLETIESAPADPAAPAVVSEPIVITYENLHEKLQTINYFGFTQENFENVTISLTEYFVSYVDSLNTAGTLNDLLTFNVDYTYSKDDFATKIAALWEGTNFNTFKVKTEKLFVKDVAASEEMDTSIDGKVLKYVYMGRIPSIMQNRVYNVAIKDDSKYSISYKTMIGGEETVFASAVADSSWTEYDSEEDIYMYNTQLECYIDNVPCGVFASIDTENLEYLMDENLTMLDAAYSNFDSAKKCFGVVETGEGTGYFDINSTMLGDYVFVDIVDVTEGHAGTNFIFSEMVFPD